MEAENYEIDQSVKRYYEVLKKKGEDRAEAFPMKSDECN